MIGIVQARDRPGYISCFYGNKLSQDDDSSAAATTTNSVEADEKAKIVFYAEIDL